MASPLPFLLPVQGENPIPSGGYHSLILPSFSLAEASGTTTPQSCQQTGQAGSTRAAVDITPCTPPGGHVFLSRCRRPGNRFPHSLIMMSCLRWWKLAAAQILGGWVCVCVCETAVQAFSVQGLPHRSFSGLRCLGEQTWLWNRFGGYRGHSSGRCAHIDSWASHPFWPSLDVGVGFSGWSTD